jgi:ribonuclease P protein component
MINVRHRFHGHGSLRAVYQRGRTVRGPFMNLRFASRDPRRPYRAAIVVSRKVSKSAVVRNRIRRRLYESIRTSPAGVAPGTDLVFTVFDERLGGLPAAELQAAVDELLRKTRA